MSLPTLDEFLASKKPFRNSYVQEPGFVQLYVRLSKRYVEGVLHEKVLDIANAEVEVEGQGTFKRLIGRLRETYPHLPIFVESVLNERLREGLPRMGFRRVGPDTDISPCYFLPSSAT